MILYKKDSSLEFLDDWKQNSCIVVAALHPYSSARLPQTPKSQAQNSRSAPEHSQLGAGIYSSFLAIARPEDHGIVRKKWTRSAQILSAGIESARGLGGKRRWSVNGREHVRLKDPQSADLCLGMTHEEVMTDIARKELRSYKQLPQIWYQIQTKFRDELVRSRDCSACANSIMKDAYSFDIDAAGLDVSIRSITTPIANLRPLRPEYMVIDAPRSHGWIAAQSHGAHSRGRRLGRELREV